MKLKLLVKTVLFCSLSYYLICHFKLQFFIGLSFSTKNTLFILVNVVLVPMLIIHNFCSTSVPVTNDDHLLKELRAEFAPYQSNAINFQGAASIHNSLGNDELVEEKSIILVEEKSIILVEKYAKEEDLEEETKLDIVLMNNQDQFVHYESELVVVENSFPDDQVKQIVCVDNESDKLESDTLNRRCDEFICIQKRKWRSEQLQFVKI